MRVSHNHVTTATHLARAQVCAYGLELYNEDLRDLAVGGGRDDDKAKAWDGKGSGGDGILRRMFPRWIQAGPHRARVLGVEPAHARHGGEGAWYVQLRRPRIGTTP